MNTQQIQDRCNNSIEKSMVTESHKKNAANLLAMCEVYPHLTEEFKSFAAEFDGFLEQVKNAEAGSVLPFVDINQVFRVINSYAPKVN